jgi:trans-2,3-dihydro-3-hydroxyanthranilate isomerase
MGVCTMSTRRSFLQIAASGLIGGVAKAKPSGRDRVERSPDRRLHFVQIDVFAFKRLQGNQLTVFTDARGLKDAEMQNIAREVNFQETTFVLPRPAAIEREQGVKVRLFTPNEETPFGGHPTLGTAMVLHNRLTRETKEAAAVSKIVLDLKVGKIPVTFTRDAEGRLFGEMQQIDPVFGKIHDRATIANLLGVKPTDISDAAPIQTVSTGLPFVIVLLNGLDVLKTLQPRQAEIQAYFAAESMSTDFFYVTRDTRDAMVGLRARGIDSLGEDPATGSASGCTASWLVRYGLQKSAETLHIEQGVEMQRPSHIYASAETLGDKITNVRVGGHAVEVAEGEYAL